MKKVDEKIIRIAAETGAKAAIEQWLKEREKSVHERADRRLHNTRLLLRNYKLFRKHADNAVYEAEHLDESVLDILDLMERNTSNVFVDSIKNSVARTVTLVQHIDVMLGIYKAYCNSTGKPEDARRWRALKGTYLDDISKSKYDIADEEGVSDRTIDRDLVAACEHLSGLFFGIDGVRMN